MALVSSVGGAAGPLYGTLFLQMGQASAGRDALDLEGWTAALDAGVERRAEARQGRAGDKTMLDALLPAVEALRAAAATAPRCPTRWSAPPRPREEGMEATIPLEARKGRASYLGPAQRRPPGPGRDVVPPAAAGRRRGGPAGSERRRSRAAAGALVSGRRGSAASRSRRERRRREHLRCGGDRDCDPDPARRRGGGGHAAGPVQGARTAAGSSSPGAGRSASWPAPTRSGSSAARISTRR